MGRRKQYKAGNNHPEKSAIVKHYVVEEHLPNLVLLADVREAIQLDAYKTLFVKKYDYIHIHMTIFYLIIIIIIICWVLADNFKFKANSKKVIHLLDMTRIYD